LIHERIAGKIGAVQVGGRYAARDRYCPQFLVADVTKAAEHYRDKLGFTIIG